MEKIIGFVSVLKELPTCQNLVSLKKNLEEQNSSEIFDRKWNYKMCSKYNTSLASICLYGYSVESPSLRKNLQLFPTYLPCSTIIIIKPTSITTIIISGN